ncbi:MAG: PDZ domain-containing protein [Deltaproteobacteria bacterium]|nr:PDZ domain-containing protein [Deltaproteobacteria bacterium]
MKRHLQGLVAVLFSFLLIFPAAVLAQTVLVSPPPSKASHSDGRAWLGVTIQDLNKDIADTMGLKTSSGVLVSEVSPGSPAEEAGVEPGDVIIMINGKDVLNSGDLVSLIQAAKSGNTVVLDLNRGGNTEKINVVLGNMPLETASGYTGSTMCAGCQGCAGTAPAGPHGGGGAGAQAPCGSMGVETMTGGGCCSGGQAAMGAMGMMGGHGKTGMTGMMESEKYGKMYLMAVSALGLTEDQQKKAQAQKSEYLKKTIRSRAEIGVAEVELKEHLFSGAVNLDKVRSKINEISAKEAELRFFRIKSLEDFKKILTPEQRKKMNEMVSPAAGCSMMGTGAGADQGNP